MSTYDYCAKGVILRDEHVVLPPSAFRGIDFVINYVGWGAVSDYSVNSPKRLDMPYSLGIPVIAMVKMDAGPYVGAQWGSPLPPADVDPHMRLLDRALFFNGTYGGQMRYYHGLMWDLTYTTDKNGVTFSATWQAGLADHLASDIGWKRYKLPWYLFGSQAMISLYQETGSGPLAVLFNKWNASAFRPAWTVGDVVLPDLSAFPLPPMVKDQNGNMVDQKPYYLHGKRWEFWQTSNEKFKIKGVTDGEGKERYVPMVLYNGSREQLFRVLNFVPPASGGGDGGNPPGDGDPQVPAGEMRVEKLDELVAHTKRIADALEVMTNGWKK